MSRTVHHVPYNHRTGTRRYDADGRLYIFAWWRATYPSTANEIRSALRYSAAALAQAERAGHRPRPDRVTRRLEAGTYPRTFNLGHVIGGISNRQERALRAADRAVGREVGKMLRGAQDAVQAAWDVESPDPRHRHFGVWDSW